MKTQMTLLGTLIGLTLTLFVAPATSFAAQAASADDDLLELEEVVVTASRREERLQDVPISVSVISGAQMAETGFQNLNDIQYAVPGVQFGTTPNDAGFRVRGIGSSGGFTSASESPVGIVVDGVVIPFGNPVESLGDIDRIEVLKGPQGTQFGKNASSGVISITTRRPVLGKFNGSAFVSVGSDSEYDVHGAVNLPVGEKAAISLYGFTRGNDGYLRNVVRNQDIGDAERSGGRGKLLWSATESVDLQVILDYAKFKTDSPSQIWTLNKLSPADQTFRAPFVTNPAALAVVPGFDNLVSIENQPGNLGQENLGAAVNLDWRVGDYTFTSVTAYRTQKDDPNTFSIDAGPLTRFIADLSRANRTFTSQELRVTSPNNERFAYVAGLFVSKLNSDTDNGGDVFLFPALPFAPFAISITGGRNFVQTTSKSAAAFADGSFTLTEKLKLLGGLRWTRDEVNASNYSVVDQNPAVPPQNLFPPNPGAPGAFPYATHPLDLAENSNSDWSGRVGLQFEPSDTVLFWGTIARGYLGPTVTFSAQSATKTEVDPQTVTDVTVGAKTQFLDRRITLNGNLFYDKYKDLQTSVFNGQEFLTENAGGFKAMGGELELGYRINPNWGVNAGVTYSDTEFTDYVTACPSGAAPGACFADPGNPTQQLYQAKGDPLPGAPKITSTLGVDYNYEFSSSLAFDASANAYYRSDSQNQVGDANTRLPSYTLLNLTTGIGSPSGSWRVAIFGRNLTDKLYHNGVIGLPFSTGSYVNWNTRDARRTVGVSVQARF